VLPLFRELRGVGLDPKLVFKIRDADIDRQDIHLSLNDGVIGFTLAIDGKITGAYFQGDGEVLVRPPGRMERASLGLFTGQGVLEEKFTSAYLRFNDDTFKELQSFLRPAGDASAQFFARNDSHAHLLAAMDATRLCISFTTAPATAGSPEPQSDKLFHARVAGIHYGVFDLYFDTLSPEQIVVGKTSTEGEQVYYDLWMSFPMRSLRREALDESRFQGPTGPAWTRDALTVAKYTINGRLDPPHEFSAEATLEAKVKQGSTRLVLFELSRYLRLKKVELDGQPLEYLQNEAVEGSELARRGNDMVAVVFPAPLQSGARFALRFTYAGPVLSDAGGGLLYVGARGIWYPNRGIAMADYDETFRFPQAWTLVATGKQVSLERDGNDYVGHWVSEAPIPIAGFNMGRYEKNIAKAGVVVVNTYAAKRAEKDLPAMSEVTGSDGVHAANVPSTPQSEVAPPIPANSRQALADKAAETLSALAQMLGPYPFSTLDVTQRPSSDSQGWPGLIFLSSLVYLPPAELNALKVSPADKLLYREIMLPHEVAHQWFGDDMSWASYHEQWLFEALANYCSLMLLERTQPAEAQAALESYRESLAVKSKSGRPMVEAGPVTLGARLSSSQFPNGYEYITYARGTWLIHMLRSMLRDASRSNEMPLGNDQLFLSLLRNLVKQYHAKEITNADFERAVEDVLPSSLWFENHKSLDWFFDGWVNGTAFPRYQLSDVKIVSRSGKLTANGAIKQNDAPSDLVTSVPVYGTIGDRKTYLGRVFAEGDETRFSLPVPIDVKRLQLDPYQTVLTAP
jgi:hypothetical protein